MTEDRKRRSRVVKWPGLDMAAMAKIIVQRGR